VTCGFTHIAVGNCARSLPHLTERGSSAADVWQRISSALRPSSPCASWTLLHTGLPDPVLFPEHATSGEDPGSIWRRGNKGAGHHHTCVSRRMDASFGNDPKRLCELLLGEHAALRPHWLLQPGSP
jgi:hypothetical protein